ncbi:MAG: SemiSWEET transporter [Gammaproteobacteria bacterium]|nr:SemiSWEET transporter [Gammaproteobacteria bacterium]
MINVDLIGTLAGALTTLAFIPQVINTWRSRSAADISLVMFLLFSSGVLLWLVYGVLIGSKPVIIANIITLALALFILWLKIKDIVQQRQKLKATDERGL